MFKQAVRGAARATMRQVVASSWSREAMNSIYLTLDPSTRTRFHREFARVFRERPIRLSQPAAWTVKFAGRRLLMPLTVENLWQEWDSAVSITANDMEVKQTYEALVTSPQCPDLFVDIGANYGTHSLLLLSAGVPTLTFEPNPACHEYFLRACALNRLTPDLQKVALGREHGTVSLTFPPRDTWNGSTELGAIQKLGSAELVTIQVEQQLLDDFLPALRKSRKLLLKIDTEGNELPVLQGAERTLAECRPTVIFESLTTDPRRGALYEHLRSFRYVVRALPFGTSRTASLGAGAFSGSSATNFIAVPEQGG